MKQVKKPINYAFIDSQNLNLGVLYDVKKRGKIVYRGKELNFKKFRDYLRTRYGVQNAYLFIGNVPKNQNLYLALQNYGYRLVMKDAVAYWDKQKKKYEIKGNVDTDIVLYSAAKLFNEYDEAVFVSGDGDFLSTYDYIASKGKLKNILAPNRYSYSKLLDNYRDKLRFVTDVDSLFGHQKRPGAAVGINALGQPGHGDKTSISKRIANVKKGVKK
jgi:uncharacterized LabA/DUF88 family protein